MTMPSPSAPRSSLAVAILGVLAATPTSHAFVTPSSQRVASSANTHLFADMSQVKTLFESNYPTWDSITAKNEEMWKKLSDAETFTLFVPSQAAFQTLGEKKVEQLHDDRNFETTNKVGLFHSINELVSADELFASGGVVTLGGEVLVDRSVTGGFFGVGGKEDGGVVVGGCKVTQSIPLEDGIIHEVDGLVSPEVLWRYMDQLRIPGSA